MKANVSDEKDVPDKIFIKYLTKLNLICILKKKRNI